MTTINSFFSNNDVNKDNAISFLINGKRKDSSFYNYIVRKIVSQLEVRDNVYAIGPALLVLFTREILSPIWDDGDTFLLELIDNYDNHSKEYISKLNYNETIIEADVFNKKINDYFDEQEINIINNDYDNIKKWIELNNTFCLNKYLDEKELYKESFKKYINSLDNIKEYIEKLKIDIISNYNMYKEIFLNNLKDSNLFEIIDFIRNNMIGKMLVKRDNVYRNYDLYELEKTAFFSKTIKPEYINEEMEKLSKEYEEIKTITDIDKYIDKAVIIFQKYIKIHPYKDGNGRSSRLLLDVLLLNRNILPPILYNSNYDRPDLDNPSHKYTIEGDIEPIISFIKSKINNTNEEYLNIINENNLTTLNNRI